MLWTKSRYDVFKCLFVVVPSCSPVTLGHLVDLPGWVNHFFNTCILPLWRST